jgi:large subunit ribosomal protein L18
MIKSTSKNKLRIKRHRRKRRYLLGTSEVPRLYVFRSLKNFYVNLVDDVNGKTLVSESSLKMKKSPDSKESGLTKEIAENLATKAANLGIKKIIFDKSGYKYHGKIKELADKLREKGLDF